MENLMKDIKGSPLVICKYKSGTFVLLCLMLIVLAMASGFMACTCVKDGKIFAALLSGVVALLFLGGVAAFYMTIKNYIVIFHTEGMVIRTIKGTVHSYSYEQIEYYQIVNNPVDVAKSFFSIKTVDKDFQFNTLCTNYEEAVSLLVNSEIPCK